MARLIIARGLPGCGKSKTAKEWVANDPDTRARVNRDDLRKMLHGTYVNGVTESMVVTAQHLLIRELLMEGHDVYCDDTNLKPETVAQLIVIAQRVWADWEIVDMTYIGLDMALVGNSSQRRIDAGEQIPEKVIIDMNERYIKGKGYPLPVPGVK